jgi:uncharacterized OB-fold protein
MTSRPLPRLGQDNRFFWTSGADGKLRFLRCEDCATFIHPARPICPNCLSESISPADVPGTGVVDTYTINRQKWHPALDVPFVIARIAIDDAPGVILTSNIIGCDPDAVAIGDRVRVRFEQHEEIFLPLFERLD